MSLSDIKPLGKEDKYGDDEIYESWADNEIFFKLSSKLVDPLHHMGLTPNMVTLLSTFFTFLSIYFLHHEKRLLASSSYLTGYLLDCVDGRMARKYSMGSDIGMALDCVSDNISNAALLLYIVMTREMNEKTCNILVVLLVMTVMLSISFGLNEAVASYEATGSDNFYERRVKQLESKAKDSCDKQLFDLFLFINKTSYASYRQIFPEYDKDKINRWLGFLKNFGPGNYCLLVGILLFYV